MTRSAYQKPAGRPGSLGGRLARLFSDYRRQAQRRWLARVTERAIAELSPQTRKDIGWPSRYDEC